MAEVILLRVVQRWKC